MTISSYSSTAAEVDRAAASRSCPHPDRRSSPEAAFHPSRVIELAALPVQLEVDARSLGRHQSPGGLVMVDGPEPARTVLPIPTRSHVGLTTYDAKDPETSFPAIKPVRPP
jgi:hypothetical protein